MRCVFRGSVSVRTFFFYGPLPKHPRREVAACPSGHASLVWAVRRYGGAGMQASCLPAAASGFPVSRFRPVVCQSLDGWGQRSYAHGDAHP